MKRLVIYLLLFVQPTFLWAQIALPVQQSLLPKNSLVVNYDFLKAASYTRGSATVANSAGTGNASVIGSPNFFNSLGFVTFNGTSQYLMTTNLRPLFKVVNTTVQKSFTISLWIFPRSLNGVIVSEHDTQTINSGFFTSNIELVNGVIKYKVWDGTVIQSSTISLNKWYHIAMVYDGASVKAYLNGVLLGTQVYDRVIPPSGQNYGVGAPSTTHMGSGTYGNFDLAQFKLYQLPLTDSDILQDYTSRKNDFDYSIHSPTTNSVLTYWSVTGVWAGDVFGGGHYTPWLNSTQGWSAAVVDTNQYLTLNFEQPLTINGIVTQGRANLAQWVTAANIDVSLNGTTWTRVVSNATLNSNSTDDVRILFPSPVYTKFVRVNPLTWNGHISMRMGLLVKPNDFVSDKLVVHYDPAMTESYSGTGTILNDLSGNGLDGTMSAITYNAPAFTYNGTSSKVSIPDNAALEPGAGDWTIEVWFKNTGNSGTVIGKYNNGGRSVDISYALRLAGANLIRADFSNGTNFQTTDNYTFTANAWVQMVYVWDKTNNSIYTYSNGVLQQTKAISISGSILNATNNLYLGSYNGGEYSQYFSGQIGVVKMYKRAVSASDVLTNYNATRSKYGL